MVRLKEFGSAVHGPYQAEHRSGAGHLMIVLDIAAMEPLAEFDARMDRLIAELKGVPLAQGFDEVLYPGELEARTDARHRREGVPLPAETIADLVRLSQQFETPLPF